MIKPTRIPEIARENEAMSRERWTFSVLWTSLVLPLSSPPLSLSPPHHRIVRHRRRGRCIGSSAGGTDRRPWIGAKNDRIRPDTAARVMGFHCMAEYLCPPWSLAFFYLTLPCMSRTRA